MNLNSDFKRKAILHSDAMNWIDFPMPGVLRKMLDRVGDEVARATSIVRYSAKSHFSKHTHSGVEEFLVLEGIFQDEHGDYPVGTYVRNPPQTQHTPRSKESCTILVKLWQFMPSDKHQVRLSIAQIPFAPDPMRPHVMLQPLHYDELESVRTETWAAQKEIVLDPTGGLEIFGHLEKPVRVWHDVSASNLT